MAKLVKAPKGYHWMKKGAGYSLMRDPKGGYAPHKGASKTAKFKVDKALSFKRDNDPQEMINANRKTILKLLKLSELAENYWTKIKNGDCGEQQPYSRIEERDFRGKPIKAVS